MPTTAGNYRYCQRNATFACRVGLAKRLLRDHPLAATGNGVHFSAPVHELVPGLSRVFVGRKTFVKASRTDCLCSKSPPMTAWLFHRDFNLMVA
jgi:hypothetical protein